MYFGLPNTSTVLENYPQQQQIKRTQNWEAEEYNELDGSLPANPVNHRRIANAVTLKSTSCLP